MFCTALCVKDTPNETDATAAATVSEAQDVQAARHTTPAVPTTAVPVEKSDLPLAQVHLEEVEVNMNEV